MCCMAKENVVFLQSQKTDVSVAQQVEHIPFKDGVLGSNPSWNTESQLNVGSFFSLSLFLEFLFLYLCN